MSLFSTFKTVSAALIAKAKDPATVRAAIATAETFHGRPFDPAHVDQLTAMAVTVATVLGAVLPEPAAPVAG